MRTSLAKAPAGDLVYIVPYIATVAVLSKGFKPGNEDWNWPRFLGWSFFVLVGMRNLITGFAFK